MNIKIKRSEECKGCAIINTCDLPVLLNGRTCPCTICIVKTMCPKEITCEEYLDYKEYLTNIID